MANITVFVDRCKGCALCIDACPKKILQLSTTKLNGKGYHPCEIIDQEKCIGCAFCATMCPDVAIKVEK